MAVWLDEIDLSDIWEWYNKLDIHDAEVFDDYRNAVVARLEGSEWAEENNFTFRFRYTMDIDQFNTVLNWLYDAADIDRVWIRTF